MATLASIALIVPLQLPPQTGHSSSQDCLTIAEATAFQGDDILELERCAGFVTDDVELLARLGTAYESAGRENEAERTYAQILSLDDEYADVHVRLARLLIGRGEGKEARRHLLRALQIQPNRGTIRSLLTQTDQPRQ